MKRLYLYRISPLLWRAEIGRRLYRSRLKAYRPVKKFVDFWVLTLYPPPPSTVLSIRTKCFWKPVYQNPQCSGGEGEGDRSKIHSTNVTIFWRHLFKFSNKFKKVYGYFFQDCSSRKNRGFSPSGVCEWTRLKYGPNIKLLLQRYRIYSVTSQEKAIADSYGKCEPGLSREHDRLCCSISKLLKLVINNHI